MIITTDATNNREKFTRRKREKNLVFFEFVRIILRRKNARIHLNT
jgi:hypothetical protein